MKKRNCVYTILILFLFSAAIGCKKFVDVSPPATSITGSSVYNSNATASAVLTGIYTMMSTPNIAIAGDISSLTMYAGLSADEFAIASKLLTNLRLVAYYHNSLSAAQGYGSEYWNILYPYIFACNAAIEGLNSSVGLTPSVKQHLIGEAKFLRAYYYFYLVNLYGDLPLVLSSDYTANASMGRSPSSKVYAQIIDDLHDAGNLLSPVYVDASTINPSFDRVRPTSWAAIGMLARSYLYSGNWQGADSASSVLIGNDLFGLSALDTVFLRSSVDGVTVVNKEAIWQLQPVSSSPANTFDGLYFNMPATGPGTGANFGVYLGDSLVNSFENGDNRKTHWVGNVTISSTGTTYYYPSKYKVNSTSAGLQVTEHLMLLRLGEQYLIRAEARAQEGNLLGAQEDLNAIRTRAGLPPTNASTQTELLAAIRHERQVELFAELGHRWFDLKRTGAIDGVMQTATSAKGGTWNNLAQLYPILNSDIQLDPNLKQNPGY